VIASPHSATIPTMPLDDEVDLSGLFPGLDPSKVGEARENLERYLGVIFRVSER